MAIFIGKRTTYLKDQSDKFRKASERVAYLITVSLAMLCAVFLTTYRRSNSVVVLIIVIIFAFVVFFRLFKDMVKDVYFFNKRQRGYSSGDRGELLVIEELKKLPNNFAVISDLIFPGHKANIDIIVTGPNAIFILEVKNHSGQISFSRGRLHNSKKRFEKDFIFQILSEQQNVNNYLKVALNNYHLVPVLVFSNRFASIRVKYPIQGVYVKSRSDLISFINNYNSGDSLDSERVLQVFKPLTIKN